MASAAAGCKSTTHNNCSMERCFWQNTFEGGVGISAPPYHNTYQLSTSYQTTSNSNVAHQDQVIKSSDQAFKHPYYDGLAQYQRAQISLIDQRFWHYSLPRPYRIFQRYLRTNWPLLILMSIACRSHI